MNARVVVVTLLALLAGCTSTTIAGKGTAGVSSASGGSAVTSTGGSVAGSAGATSATASGTGTGASSTSAGGSTGTSGSTAGSSTGTGTGSSTGPCLPFGTICGSNPSCCSGSCDATCGQAAGAQCLSAADCSSGNCDGGACGCSTSLAGVGGCATDADCCNGVSCTHEHYGDKQYGLCCSQVGGNCLSDPDCCNQSCKKGTCACLPEGPADCRVDSDCCAGKCVSEGENGNYCLNGPGGQCDGGADCYTNTCGDGTCGTCSAINGVCSGDLACCAGLACAGSFQEFEQDGPQHELVDAGSTCCALAGAGCGDAGDCCSQTCTQGSCVCAKTTQTCYDDQSCCAGGACMLPLQANDEFGIPVCCQATGQFCVSNPDCCTENCVDEQCACVAAGGQCGPGGLVAPAGPGACCSGACSDAGACL